MATRHLGIPPNATTKLSDTGYKVKVTRVVSSVLNRLSVRMKPYQEFDAQPAIGSTVMLLVHPPARTGKTSDYVASHLRRVQLQDTLSASLPSVAKPIAAGYDPTLKSFITITHLDPAASVLNTKKVPPIVFASLEKALASIWVRGLVFSTIDARTILTNPSNYSVTLHDLSPLMNSGWETWKSQEFLTATAQTIETLYVTNKHADALFLRKLRAAVVPSNDHDEQTRLIADARSALWAA